MFVLLPVMMGVIAMVLSSYAEDFIPLRVTTQNVHDATVQFLENGEIAVRTTGSDPYLFTEPFDAEISVGQRHVLAFEYFSTEGTDRIQVFVVPPLREEYSVITAGLARSEGWASCAVDLKPVLVKTGGRLRNLRLDFGNLPGRTIRIRNLRLRAMTDQERRLAAQREARQRAEKHLEARLQQYLTRSYPCQITRVTVEAEQIQVEGRIAGKGRTLLLAEVPLYLDVTNLNRTSLPLCVPLSPDARGRFVVRVARNRDGNDRLLSRWVVVQRTRTGWQLMSHARYPDTVHAQWRLPVEKPRNRKGIGALWVNRPMRDLDELGLSAATVNILLNALVRTRPGPGRVPFLHAGRTWYADAGYLAQIDMTLQEAAKRQMIVSAIILVAQAHQSPDPEYGRILAHPDADPTGIYVMPDLTSRQGVTAYAATLDFLARRYSRPDNRYGRIHHWILHNEVNAGWIWTNAGEKTALLYMDLYHRSMRIAHLIARQYNPHAQVFISLEHHWTLRPSPKFYAGRDLLDLLLRFSAVEGDFDWAVAFHPYPQDLFNPRVWEDTQAVFSLDTPKITFKNLEVLDAWARQPRTFFLGRHRRTIHLTEQGLNARDYSETALREQAAGMAYAWSKLRHLPGIALFHYHNWVDDRAEGGLRIGLRRFPDDPEDPMGRKPIWYVYQALETEREQEVTAPYLPVVGVRDWSEVHYRNGIGATAR
ncbi:MAG: DUF5722 domain-containing protein [Chloroherpetonaceae bacterium]|nr:DUF5722 domain-containing protein [Chthonomonadaceae bacterium]MDW8206397.1 DUF5722 domain-containing protein [Chloroherpetonaceae bacterium]